MSQRNPMNERYTSEERSGKTRKSAASAKPTSKAASSVRMQSSKSNDKPKGFFSRARNESTKDAGTRAKEKAQKRAAQEERFAYHDPDTDEYKKWRRIWWGCIAGAIVMTALSMYLLNAMNNRAGVATLILGYIMLGLSIFIDIKKVRKIRNQHHAESRLNRSKEATKTRKQEKAERKQREAEMVAEAEAKEAAKQAKRQAKASKFAKLTGGGGASSSKEATTESDE